jgi:hypothetical protein
LPMPNNENKSNCNKFKSCLGKPIVITRFLHKPNSIEYRSNDIVRITTGFYEPSQKFYNEIKK